MCCSNKMVVMDRGVNSLNAKTIVKDLKHYEEFICGWGSAFINIMITFPVNKIMFRQMLHGIESQHAYNQIKQEGMRYLYRGCMPPLLQKTASVSLMFGTFNSYSENLGSFSILTPMAVRCSAAILAGCTEALLAPLERVQSLLQIEQYHNKFKNTAHAFRELKKFGLKEYYRGMTPILIRNSVGNILFFSLKDEVRGYLPHSDSLVQKVLNDFISGACVGAFSSTIFYPMNVVKTKMQSSCGTPFVSLFKAFEQTYIERDRSIRKMYIGVHVNYTRAFLSWGIINASHQFLKQWFFSESATEN